MFLEWLEELLHSIEMFISCYCVTFWKLVIALHNNTVTIKFMKGSSVTVAAVLSSSSKLLERERLTAASQCWAKISLIKNILKELCRTGTTLLRQMLQSQCSEIEISCPVNSFYILCSSSTEFGDIYCFILKTKKTPFSRGKATVVTQTNFKRLLSMFEKLVKWKCLVVFKSEKLKWKCWLGLAEEILMLLQLNQITKPLSPVNGELWLTSISTSEAADRFLGFLGQFLLPHFKQGTFSAVEYEKCLLKSLLFVLYVSKQVIFICWSSIFRCELRSTLWFQKCWSPGSF